MRISPVAKGVAAAVGAVVAVAVPLITQSDALAPADWAQMAVAVVTAVAVYVVPNLPKPTGGPDWTPVAERPAERRGAHERPEES